MVWKALGLEAVTVTAYFYPPASDPPLLIAVSASANPTTEADWTTIQTTPVIEPGAWNRHIYGLADISRLLPGARFVRIKWTNGDSQSFWTPQISQVRLTQLVAPIVVDPLNDATKFVTSLSSSNLAFATAPPVANPDDPSRLVRTSPPGVNQGVPGWVTWKDSGIRSFSATAYTYTLGNTDPPLLISTSTDGNTWTRRTPAVNVSPSGVANWSRHVYLIDNLINVNYIRMEWTASAYPTSPQIGEVRMAH
jgi:hypothetical protein